MKPFTVLVLPSSCMFLLFHSGSAPSPDSEAVDPSTLQPDHAALKMIRQCIDELKDQ